MASPDRRPPAPEFQQGLDWLNVERPLTHARSCAASSSCSTSGPTAESTASTYSRSCGSWRSAIADELVVDRRARRQVPRRARDGQHRQAAAAPRRRAPRRQRPPVPHLAGVRRGAWPTDRARRPGRRRASASLPGEFLAGRARADPRRPHRRVRPADAPGGAGCAGGRLALRLPPAPSGPLRYPGTRAGAARTAGCSSPTPATTASSSCRPRSADRARPRRARHRLGRGAASPTDRAEAAAFRPSRGHGAHARAA